MQFCVPTGASTLVDLTFMISSKLKIQQIVICCLFWTLSCLLGTLVLHQFPLIGFTPFCLPLMSQIELNITSAVILNTTLESILYLTSSVLNILLYFHVKGVKNEKLTVLPI